MKWSKDYDKCIICHKTEHPHSGKGICSKCRHKQYTKQNDERIKLIRRKYSQELKKDIEEAEKMIKEKESE
jgi:hypothetical protein